MIRTLSLVLLLACTGEETDTDPPEDTGTDTDVPDTVLGFIEKPSDVDRSGDQLRAGLLQVTIAADGTWTPGANLPSSTLSGTGNFGIVLPETNPADEVDLPGGARGTLYLPIIFQDQNRNETFEEGAEDSLIGFAPNRWLAWISSGADREGWVIVDATGDPLVTYPLSEQVVVRLRGLGAESRLEGIYTGTEVAAGVVGIDERRISGGEAGDWSVADAVVNPDSGDLFIAEAEGRPPIGVFQFPDGAPRYVKMAMVFFSDSNRSGGYTEEDTLLPQALCRSGDIVYARYVDTPRTLAVARDLERLGWTSGWRFVTGPFGSEEELNTDDIRRDRYGDGCSITYAD